MRDKHVIVDASPDDWPSIANLPASQANLFKLFSGGITQVLWSNRNFNEYSIGKDCKNALTAVADHLKDGSEWAFKGIVQYPLSL